MVLDEPTNDLDMDTLDLLEELLADYDGTLILVSHDRDFIDRLATSTIALDGRGRAVETPGGWSDLIRQNPGFFEGADAPASSSTIGAGKPAEVVAPAKRLAKLSYKDQRRLEELDRTINALPAEISRIEAELADPGLYARDPEAFDRLMQAIDRARSDLSAAEEEWFALEAQREGVV
jgi:ATP-binding cassette subfamily F protein uup